MLYIGVDLGTSACKCLLCDEKGKILNSATKEYPLEFPHNGWAQQHPSYWIEAVKEDIKELLKTFDASQVKGIGVAGQMHGLVVLDKDDKVIRPAILWNDGRTFKEVDYLNNAIGKQKLSEYCANIAFAGFTAPKLLWMKANEPDLFAKITKIMLPKDYVNYILTGVHSSDVSDASGTLLFDVKNKCWSKEMLEICDLKMAHMPTVFESYEKIGNLKKEIAEELGLNEDVFVVAGAGDNAAAAIGTNTVNDGNCNISLGTSGTIFIACDRFTEDDQNALHSFAHANGHYHLMGCMLSAASCNKWLMEAIFKTTDYNKEQQNIDSNWLGHNEVYFLPYLMGERSPINDTNARGTFTGLTMNTPREKVTLSVLEGVAFAIRDSLEVARGQGLCIERSTICGGGAKSSLWKKIIANVLNVKLDVLETEQGPGLGACLLAISADGVYKDIMDTSDKLVHVIETIEPDKALAEAYEIQYQKYRMIYPALKNVFKEIA